jgi:hypothetical protein
MGKLYLFFLIILFSLPPIPSVTIFWL